MRLIITRHGETEENKLGILQGHLPGKLSDLGKIQAEKLAKRLKDEKIYFIYSSDLARASDTAKEIAKFHPGIPIEFTKDLRERNLGELQGQKIFDLTNLDFLTEDIKNAETLENLYIRAENFLNNLVLKHKLDTVLFIGHDLINRTLMTVIFGKTYKDINDVELLNNTSVNIFEIDEKGNYKIHLLNDTKHLE